MLNRNPRDFAAGAFLVLVAALILWATWDLPLGRGVRLGPGFVPFVLGCMIALLGTGIMVWSARFSELRTAAWRVAPLALFGVIGAIAVFALVLERFGLAVASPLLVVIASLGFGRLRPLEVTALAIVLTLGAVLLFSYALGLTIPVFV